MIIKNEQDQHFVSTKFRGIQQKLLNKNSRAESRFAELLLNAGFYFRREKCNYQLDNRWSYYDFFIPSLKLYIEIDGNEHLLPSQIEIDKQKTHQVIVDGDKLIRYTNQSVKNMNEVSLENFMAQIYERIKKRKNRTFNVFKQSVVSSAAIDWVLTMRVFGKDVAMRPYFLFDNDLGAIYYFKNLGDLRIATAMDVKPTKSLLARTSDNNAKKFILSTTLSDCKERTLSRFGCTVDKIIDWSFPHFIIERNDKVMTSHHVFNRVVEDETLRHENFDEYVQSKIDYYAKKNPNIMVVPDYERKTIILESNYDNMF